ncbi:DsbA family protein [Vagococcus hydrophili]|uniref:DsbA family protein n=1 Tax=Vagococcus hydrophili TaxID=2714947 RepID=A0A6G8ARJ7_9ENTE|nr:DsbA family protein [Vagococcus hydrophili]QIL47617.1 DsbA family protein [Vagococcus hydrophili]
MIEIYLFINPLDEQSLAAEKKYLDIIKQETEKIHFRLIPVLNPRVIQNYLVANNITTHNLSYRNELFSTIYSACLDLKAVQLQGKQIGRAFLFELQKRVGGEQHVYSKELVTDILQSIDVDLDLYEADRASDLVVDFFKIDQQIAQEMNVDSFADAVIFNYRCDRDFGVLVDDNTPNEIIYQLFETDCGFEKYYGTDDDNRLHLY